MLLVYLNVIVFQNNLYAANTPVATASPKIDYKMFIDGKELVYQYKPITENNEIYVPMYKVLSALGINSAVDKDGFGTYRINTPDSILFIKSGTKMFLETDLKIENFETKDESYSPSRDFITKIVYPKYFPITRKYVVYLPISFLKNNLYLNVDVDKDNNINIKGGNYDIEPRLISLYEKWKDKFSKVGSSYLNYWYFGTYEGFKSFYFKFHGYGYPEKLSQLSEISKYLNKSLWIYKPNNYWLVSEYTNLTEITLIKFDFDRLTFKYGNKTTELSIPDQLSFENGFLKENPFTAHKWSKKVWDSIKAEDVYIGMNSDMVILAIGHPSDINTTKTRSGTSQQWVYSDKYSTKYYYFNNNILTTIQD